MKSPPKNTSEIASSYEIKYDLPPQNLYAIPTRYHMQREYQTYKQEQSKASKHKILNYIEQEQRGLIDFEQELRTTGPKSFKIRRARYTSTATAHKEPAMPRVPSIAQILATDKASEDPNADKPETTFGEKKKVDTMA